MFPDEAPSRFKVALRSGSTTEIERTLAEYRQIGADEPARAAERLLELVAALSRHDRLTRGHSERVRAYSQMIGEELRLPPSEIDKLRWAALIHDVGKLEVPYEILNKPGALTPEEYEIVKRHAAIGAELAAPLANWLGEPVRAVGEHHERWDGRGYPNGLRGEEISLAGRIVSVADAFDVMTSVRSYKKARTPVAARAELADCAGTQFDPTVVRAFLCISLGRLRLAMGPLSWLAQLALFPPGLLSAAVAPAAMAVAGVVAAAVGAGVGTNDLVSAGSRPAPVVVNAGFNEASDGLPTAVTISVPPEGANPYGSTPTDVAAAPDESAPPVTGTVADETSSTLSGVTTTTGAPVSGTTTVAPSTTVSKTTATTSPPTTTRPPITTIAPTVPTLPVTVTTIPPAATTLPATTTLPPATTTLPPTTTTLPPTTTTSPSPPPVSVYLLGSSGVGNVTQTVLPIVARAPLNATLPDFDSDGDLGLTLTKGFLIFPGTTQRFRLDPSTTIQLNGPASLSLYAAARNLNAVDVQVQIVLLDCPDGNGSCTQLVSRTRNFTGTAGAFTAQSFDFGSLSRTIAPSRNLELRITATVGSGHDVWLAYDTVGYESALTLTS